MPEHKHQGPRAPHARRTRRARARSHPLTLAFGLLIVAGLVTALVLAVRVLYSDYAWHASARSSADAVAQAIEDASANDDSNPVPVDGVAGPPGPGQVAIDQLVYGADIPADVTRIRLTEGGALTVLTQAGALCSGVTFSMSEAGERPSGSFTCGDAVPPPTPLGLRATPRDAAVVLQWQHSPVPVEDFTVSYSRDGGAHWTVYDDGVSADTQANVSSLINGRPYLFRVAATNLAGDSPTATTSASPFTRPSPPSEVRATGGLTTIVSWTPSTEDGGRPVTGYIVDGYPSGTCLAVPPATSCEITDLPAARAYTFTVRAVNDAGPGAPSSTSSDPVAVFSVPGPPVALEAAPADRAVLLTWTPPLLDGNTPIVDYRVEFRVSGAPDWIEFEHAPSAATAQAVSGLTNGTEYDFQVMAVNGAGVSDPSPSPVSQAPATVPDAVGTLLAADADAMVTLSWLAPAFDGGAPLTDYAVQYAAKGGRWTTFDHDASTDLQRVVTGLDNGSRYWLRVAAVNIMGTGAWSERIAGRPFTHPGPVLEPVAEGSRTAVVLTWQPPAEDGGRPLTAYRVQYRLASEAGWQSAGRLPARRTAVTVPRLATGEAYDFRIVAVNEAGAGPSDAEGTEGPTIAGVIVDEMPPAPTGVSGRPGNGTATLTWRASPAGPKSPIVSYTVTGAPSGTCTTTGLGCVVTGLTNGVPYDFTVIAANASQPGPPSRPVSVTPRPYNEATGGTVTTYSKGGRTFRVHTFATGSTFTVTSGTRAFDVLIVAGGAGSALSADAVLSLGGGGGILAASRARLAAGQWAVTVGQGGAPGAGGGPSSLDGVGSAPAGALAPGQSSPATSSSITGTAVTYGGAGTPTSGAGADGRGSGAGGPTANRGGNGVVIIRYEVAP